MKELGLDDASYAQAVDELVSARLARTTGSGGRLARAAVASGDLSVEAEMLLNALPPDGSTAGNYGLRSQLDLDDETYKSAKRELLTAQRVAVGVGYGGTLARAEVLPVSVAASEPSGRGLVSRESDLYAPFADWLSESLEDQDLAFANAKITATARGRSRGGGALVPAGRYSCASFQI
jgi:hypothetical protein